MNSRATQQFNVSPYIYAVYWLRPGSSAFLSASWECNWLAWVMVMRCVMRHAYVDSKTFIEWPYCLFPILWPRFWGFLSMSKVELPLMAMGKTAGYPLLFSALLHIFITHFIADYVNKTYILTDILNYLSINKALRIKIPSKDVFETTNFDVAKHYCLTVQVNTAFKLIF